MNSLSWIGQISEKGRDHVLKNEWIIAKKAGESVPFVNFVMRIRVRGGDVNPFEWKTIDSVYLFKGKRVVVFSVPGAFTPLCSARHLPEYEASYSKIKALGIDDVYCLSPNDAFVLRQWGLKQGLEEDESIGSLGFKRVKLIPDGTLHFTRAMGMSNVWNSSRGLGERSWRYSMVVKDGVIEKIFTEPGRAHECVDDPLDKTDAVTMLSYLIKSVLV